MAYGTYLHASGAWHPQIKAWVRLSGTWRPIPYMYAKVAGVWKQVFGTALSASFAPSTASGSGPAGTTVNSNSVTVTPSGGVPGYTYLWTYLSGDAAIFTTFSTANNVQQWSRGTPGSPTVFAAVWKCRVTDSIGQTFDVNVPVVIQGT